MGYLYGTITMIGTHILYVGRDPVEARLIMDLLRVAGAERPAVEQAEAASAAIGHLAASHVDAVLLDFEPNGSHIADLKCIAAAAPAAAIILLVDDDSVIDPAEAVRLGVQDILPRDEITGPALWRALRLARERVRSRQELCDGDGRFQLLFDSVPVGIVRASLDGTLFEVNEPVVELLGYPDKETLLAVRAVDLLTTPVLHSKIAAQLMQHGALQDVTAELKRYDGTTVWIEGSVNAIHDEVGRITCIEAAIKDITNQHQARDSVDSLARFPSENPNIVMRLSSDGRVLQANPAGSSFLQRLDPAGVIPIRWHETVELALQCGTPVQLADSYGESSYNITFAPIVSAGYVNVYASDITSLKRIGNALHESEQRYRNVIEQSADGIFLIDDRARVLEWNPAMERITGFSREDALDAYAWDIYFGLTPREQRVEVTRDQMKAAMLGMIEQGRSGQTTNRPLDIEIERPDGERRTVQAVVFVTQNSRHLRMGGTLRDITELKDAEAAEHEQRSIAEALQKSTAVLNSTLDLDEVLQLILMTTSHVVPSDGSLLVMVEDGIAQVSHCQGYYYEEGLAEDVLRISGPVESLHNWQQMAETGQPVVIDDVCEYPGWVEEGGMQHVRAYLGAPIIHEGELLGFINLTSKTPAAFTARHAEHLKTFSDQVAIAICNAKLYETEQHRRRIAETLRRASAVFSSTLALDEVLNRIMEQIGEVLPYDSASVQQLEGRRLVIRAARGFDDSADLIGQGFPITERFPNKQVIETKRPLALADPVVSYPAFYEDSDQYQSGRIRTWLGIPLIASDQVIGLITLDRNEVKPYTEEEIALAVAFANHAATALENARLYAELENYSSILVQAVHEATGELRQALEHLQAILDNSPDAILLLDHNGTIDTGNPAFERLFGFQQDQVLGHRGHKLLDDAHTTAFDDALGAVLSQHVTRRLEVTARRRNGSTFDAEIALAPILEDERLLGIVCSLRDISAFKDVERMKDALVSTAAHELRTPLTTIQGFSEILLDRELNEERQCRYLKLINQQSEQLGSIVNDLLDISRLESGHGLSLNPRPIEIAPIVCEAAEPFVETHPNHAFEFVGLDDVPQVYGDPFRLGQVVKNLVSNAVKYSPEGGPITIRAQAADGWLYVSVQDAGVGIDDEQLSHIFDRFYRADSSNTAISGTGLGLTICKLIVEGHGGSIEVESEYGRGSTFTFSIPLAGEPAGS